MDKLKKFYQDHKESIDAIVVLSTITAAIVGATYIINDHTVADSQFMNEDGVTEIDVLFKSGRAKTKTKVRHEQ